MQTRIPGRALSAALPRGSPRGPALLQCLGGRLGGAGRSTAHGSLTKAATFSPSSRITPLSGTPHHLLPPLSSRAQDQLGPQCPPVQTPCPWDPPDNPRSGQSPATALPAGLLSIPLPCPHPDRLPGHCSASCLRQADLQTHTGWFGDPPPTLFPASETTPFPSVQCPRRASPQTLHQMRRQEGPNRLSRLSQRTTPGSLGGLRLRPARPCHFRGVLVLARPSPFWSGPSFLPGQLLGARALCCPPPSTRPTPRSREPGLWLLLSCSRCARVLWTQDCLVHKQGHAWHVRACCHWVHSDAGSRAVETLGVGGGGGAVGGPRARRLALQAGHWPLAQVV